MAHLKEFNDRKVYTRRQGFDSGEAFAME